MDAPSSRMERNTVKKEEGDDISSLEEEVL
jgi:hypothetical protein